MEQELDMFIHHEVGESQPNILEGENLKRIIKTFPDSVLEFFARAVKDILADTHSKGLLSYIIRHRRKSSLGFYAGFLDGMRKMLCPEVVAACREFWEDNDWSKVDKARLACRANHELYAAKLQEIGERLTTEPAELVENWAEKELLAPLGLGRPSAGQ